MSTKSILPELVRRFEAEILNDWMREQRAAITLRADLLTDAELARQSAEFFAAFQAGLQGQDLGEITGPAWGTARDLLKEIARLRSRQGFSLSETATFVFSLKQPLFSLCQRELEREPALLVGELWTISVIIDKLGLFTAESALAAGLALILDKSLQIW